MAKRLFVVSYPHRGAYVPGDRIQRTTAEAFVVAESMGGALRSWEADTINRRPEPTGIREAGPVAANIVRRMSDKFSLLGNLD